MHNVKNARTLNTAARAAIASTTALFALCALLSTDRAALAQAQSFPSKPIRVIVAHPPGTPVDLVVRVVAEKLREAGGQPLIVENRTGESGGIGAEVVARAAPDGHTLLATIDATVSVAKLIYPKFPVDPAKEFAMVAMLGDRGVQVLVIPADSRAQNLKEFIDQARGTDPARLFRRAGRPGRPHEEPAPAGAPAAVPDDHVQLQPAPTRLPGRCLDAVSRGPVLPAPAAHSEARPGAGDPADIDDRRRLDQHRPLPPDHLRRH